MKLISNSMIYFSGSIISKLLSLLSLPFLTAALSPEEYGVVAMLILVGAFVSSFLSLGLGTSIGEMYFSKQDFFHRSSVLTTGFLVILGTHIVYCILIWVVGEKISEVVFHSKSYVYVSVMMLLGQAVQNMVFPLQLKVQFEEKFKIAALAMVLSAIVSLGMILFLVVVEERGLNGYGEGMLIGAIAQLLIYLVLVRLDYSAKKMLMAVDLIKKGWPMILSFLFLFVIQNGVRIPIEWYGGLAIVGLYQVGASLAAPMGMVTTAFINAWTPYALGFSSRPDDAPESLGAVTRLYIVIMGIIVILIFVLAPFLAKILTAEKYFEAYYVIGLGALWHYFSSIFLMLLPPVYFANEVARTVVRVQAVTVVVFCAICIPLINVDPLMGAAGSVALAGFVLVFSQLIWNKVLRAHQYVQIHYDIWSIVMLILIPLGGILVLFVDIFVGYIESVLLGTAMIALLVCVVFASPLVSQLIKELQLKIVRLK